MTLDLRALKQLGIVLQDSEILEEAYSKMKAVPTLTLNNSRMLMLDLDSLPKYPVNFKEVFLRWALQANKRRIEQGEEPLFPLELVSQCPLWKAVKMPLISLELTKSGIFNRPSPSVGKGPQPRVINRG